ncbi:MAG TPA: flagellar hook-associated protein FlgK [Geminicoccaceae bacterium]|nr:flagellar hook-associated protein FlgK [Geminicoccus sp.]HMU50228.1 flagellar hook-associated protein FlgK [Geminicoccaceae bacterium]
MSLSATLSNALSGLEVAQRALAVTANNVANAGTTGYSRKQVVQETVVVGGQGLGVRAADVSRVVDEYLEAELKQQSGQLGRDQALSDALARVQDTVFGGAADADRGIASAIETVSTALEAFAASSESSTARLSAVAATEDLLDRIDAGAEAIQTIRRDLDSEIGRTVRTINDDLRSLDDINDDIARAGATAELLDQRDALIGRIAENIDLTVLEKDDGTVSLYTAGGVALLEDEPRAVVYTPASAVGEATTFGSIAVYRQSQIDPATGKPLPGEVGGVLVSAGVRASLSAELRTDSISDADQLIVSRLTSGRLQGLIEARDRALPEIVDQLGELASLVEHAFNAAHNDAAAYPPPSVLQGSRTDLTSYDGSANAGTAYLAVVDRSGGSTAAVVAVDVTAVTPADIVAQINAGLGSLGTASIGSDGALRIVLADASQGIAISEGDSSIVATDTAGRTRDYGFSHYFGLNDLIVADGASVTDLAIRGDIAADTSLLSSAKLDVAIGPPLSATLGGVGDRRGAQALADALETPQATIARGSLAAGSSTIAGYAADLVANAAATAARAETRATAQAALVDDLTYRSAAVSGVNVDEELARLVTYQQAYTVAARLISITDELFGELLAIKR